MSEYEVYMAEHNVLLRAQEWMGMNGEHASEDLSYVEGVIDMADELLSRIKEKESLGVCE